MQDGCRVLAAGRVRTSRTTEAHGRLDDRIQDALHVGRGRSDHAKHLGERRLVLERRGDLTIALLKLLQNSRAFSMAMTA